jgi:hypothetical protein
MIGVARVLTESVIVGFDNEGKKEKRKIDYTQFSDLVFKELIWDKDSTQR